MNENKVSLLRFHLVDYNCERDAHLTVIELLGTNSDFVNQQTWRVT